MLNPAANITDIHESCSAFDATIDGKNIVAVDNTTDTIKYMNCLGEIFFSVVASIILEHDI